MQHNKNNPLVSIITLTFNKFHYLFETLESAKIQDYPYIELIISDDGSLDFPEKEVNEFIKTLPENFVNVIVNQNSNNLGIVKNFNHAIGLSKGDIIVPLSCDDLFYDNHSLSHIVNFFETNPEFLIATGKRELYDEEMNPLKKILPVEKDVYYLKGPIENLYKRLCFGNFISGACIYYKKNLITKYGLFDEDFFFIEDYPTLLKITQEGEKIGFIEENLLKYRSGGVSNILKTRYIFDHVLMFKKFIFENKSRFKKREFIKIQEIFRRFFIRSFEYITFYEVSDLKRIEDLNYIKENFKSDFESIFLRKKKHTLFVRIKKYFRSIFNA